MYTTLLTLHSLLRWLVLASLIYALYRSYKGYHLNGIFTKTDDAIRHWTATVAHIQLIIGFMLYIKSPVVKYFWASDKKTLEPLNISFFGWIHILLMLLAIIIITIGSAKAKRMNSDPQKFKTVLIWFGLALFIIFLAIPWPFSPCANRPYIRPF